MSISLFGSRCCRATLCFAFFIRSIPGSVAAHGLPRRTIMAEPRAGKRISIGRRRRLRRKWRDKAAGRPGETASPHSQVRCMAQINIMVSRHSAFYTPLISTITGGFLGDEGLEPTYSIATPRRSVAKAILDGSVDLAQSAVSRGWGSAGARPEAGHLPLRPDQRTRRLFPRRTRARTLIFVGQVGGKRGPGRSRRPAAGHVSLRAPQGGHRLRQP